MKKLILVIVFSIFLGSVSFAATPKIENDNLSLLTLTKEKPQKDYPRKKKGSYKKKKTVSVKSYTTKSGKHVRSYKRRARR